MILKRGIDYRSLRDMVGGSFLKFEVVGVRLWDDWYYFQHGIVVNIA